MASTYRTLSQILLFAAATGACSPAWAERFETSLAIGPSFFSGDSTQFLTPTFGTQMSYSASALWSPALAWSHHFTFSLLGMGKTLAGQPLAYNGLAGTYSTGMQINFSQNAVSPFVEAGPALSILALYTSGGPDTQAKSQTALKYGYYITTGFDRIYGKGRGHGGWGMAVTYFQLMPSAGPFEFPAGAVGAKGVQLDFRFLIAPSRTK